MVSVLTRDHRGSTEPELLEGLHAREPLALAEAYHRTVNATHAVASRLLGSGSSDEIEAVLRQLYAELWQSPPVDEPLEGWLRGRCFAIAADHLHEVREPAAAPSTAALLPELGAAPARALEPGEQVLAELDESERLAFAHAHDQGMATHEQPDPDAELALNRALEALAGEPGGEGPQREDTVVPLLADWVLGLLPPAQAVQIDAEMADRPSWSARARLLRRGRRRLEGLPPAPDMGQRVLVAILAEDREADLPMPRHEVVDLTDDAGDLPEREPAGHAGGREAADREQRPEHHAAQADEGGRRRRGGLLTRLRGGTA